MVHPTDVSTQSPAPRWRADAPADGFDGLYRDEFHRLAGVLFAMSGKRLLAEEVAQDSFAHAWSRWSRVRDCPSPAGWVYTTGFRLLRRRMRHERRLLPFSGRWSPDPSESTGERIDVLNALRNLPARQQHVVVLRHLLGLSTIEVAHRLGQTEGSVRSTLHRAMRSLRSALDDPVQGGSHGR